MDFDLFFPPWIGNEYLNKDNIFNGKKIMVVGHNHHDVNHYDSYHGCGFRCENYLIPGKCDGKDFTKVVINDYLGYNDEKNRQRYYKTFDKFTDTLTTNKGKKDVWNSIIFYNFLQRAVSKQGKSGNPEEISLSKHAFIYLLNALPQEMLPDIIIAWGEKNVYWKIGEFFNENLPELISGKKGWIKKGRFKGKEILLICIHHPSYRFYNTERWRKALEPYVTC